MPALLALTAWVLAAPLPDLPYIRARVGAETSSDHCQYWPEGSRIVWQAESTGNPDTPGDTEVDAMRKAFNTWNAQLAACGSLSFVEGPRTSSRLAGYVNSASATNENVVLFRFRSCAGIVPLADSCYADEQDDDDCGSKFDCWDGDVRAMAYTTTTFHAPSGQILDADIEFNVAATPDTAPFVFTAVDSPACVAPSYHQGCVAWDIQNTMTHEIGHLLGLGHTGRLSSVMAEVASPTDVNKRVLDEGTRSFVCEVYPRGEVAKDCVVRPISAQLGAPVSGCGCSALEPLAAGVLALLGRRLRVRARRAVRR